MKIQGSFKQFKALVSALDLKAVRPYCFQVRTSPAYSVVSDGYILYRAHQVRTEVEGSISGQDLKKDIKFLGLTKMPKDTEITEGFEIDTDFDPNAGMYPAIEGAFLTQASHIGLMDLKRLREALTTLIDMGETRGNLFYQPNQDPTKYSGKPLHIACIDDHGNVKAEALVMPTKI